MFAGAHPRSFVAIAGAVGILFTVSSADAEEVLVELSPRTMHRYTFPSRVIAGSVMVSVAVFTPE